MKIAWITTHGTYFGPEHFDDNQINKARNHGVKIGLVTSKTLGGEKYMANICPHCGTFVGQFFIHEYLYGEQYKEEIDISEEAISQIIEAE